jgi:hypothetical protein
MTNFGSLALIFALPANQPLTHANFLAAVKPSASASAAHQEKGYRQSRRLLMSDLFPADVTAFSRFPE